MNKNIDEVFTTLLKAKEKIYNYTKEKVKNENWQPYYNGIIEELDNIIVDHSIVTKMSDEELINCYLDVGADNKNSIYHEEYNTIKENMGMMAL